MIIDLVTLGFILLLVYKGFDRGFVPTFLGFIGYVVGGLLGLISAREFTSDWSGLWSVIGLHLLMILIGAKLGQASSKVLGKGIRGIIGPFKFIDSLLGGVIGGIKAAVIAVVALVFLSVVPNEALQGEIKESQLRQFSKSYMPGVLEDALMRMRELSQD